MRALTDLHQVHAASHFGLHLKRMASSTARKMK
jgi:hypothetical protein